jgi:hypothetical protein
MAVAIPTESKDQFGYFLAYIKLSVSLTMEVSMSRKKRERPDTDIGNLLDQTADLLKKGADPNARARAISANDQLAAHVASLCPPSKQGEEE